MGKRITIVACILVALNSVATARTTLVAPRRSLVETLTAEFFVQTNGKIEAFYIRARRWADIVTGTERFKGEAYYGTCVGGLCRLTGPPVKVAAFKIAKDYSRAEIRLSSRAYAHYVRFESVGSPPDPKPNVNTCDGATVDNRVRWHANAFGRVFGRRVSTANEVAKRREPEAIDVNVHINGCSP